MTDPEFDRWCEDVYRKFPPIRQWIAGTTGAGIGLLEDWRDALGPCDLSDLLSVNVRMLAGDDDGPGKFPTDWQTLPAHVRRLAQAVRLRREVSEPADRGSYEPQGPRYRCRDCRDTGRRFVAHYAMVAAWYAGDVTGCRYRTAVVLCGCPAMDAVRTRQGNESKREGVATFKEGLHFPLPYLWLPQWEIARPPPEMFEQFVAWCEASHKAWADSKRHREFDEFNNQDSNPKESNRGRILSPRRELTEVRT